MTRIAFDIGASTMRLAEITPDGIGRVHRADTPKDPLRAVEKFVLLARAIGPTVEGAHGGIPAIVDTDGSVVTATNLPEWNGFPFAYSLGRALGAPVRVRNDAELAGLGEATYGAGKGKRTVAYLGLGTGVGTSCVVEGAIQPHSSDGEARDAIIALPSGTLEKRIGGRALQLRFGMAPRELPRTVWATLTLLLVDGIEHAVRLWNPDVLVLGGSLMDEEDGFRMEEIARTIAVHAPELLTVSIRRAALADSSGLYGAKAWCERETAA